MTEQSFILESITRRMFTVPALVNRKLMAFCHDIEPGRKPLYVDVRPDLLPGDRSCRRNKCYKNVREYCELAGGWFQHGWLLWECESAYLHAAHHCIHFDGTNHVDVTPGFSSQQICFLPSASPGTQDRHDASFGAYLALGYHHIPSRFTPLVKNTLVDQIIALQMERARTEWMTLEWWKLSQRVFQKVAFFWKKSERRKRLLKKKKVKKRKQRISARLAK